MTSPSLSSVLHAGFLLALIALAFVVRVQIRQLRLRALQEPVKRSLPRAIGAWLVIVGVIVPLPAWNLWQAIRYGKILNMPKYGANHWEYISTSPGWFWYTALMSVLTLLAPFALLAYVLHLRRRTLRSAAGAKTPG